MLLKHTFRLSKQVLGWTAPKIRDPAAADWVTWIILACCAQLYLARDLAADLRLLWQQRCPPGRLTPARARRGFRCIRQALPSRPARRNPPDPARPARKAPRRPAHPG